MIVDDSAGYDWDKSQQRAIGAPVSARQIVVAPPGAGKTEVACGRVAHLLDQGVSGDAILLLSFTNAAVNEMKARIRQLVTDAPYQVSGVQVRTIDSLAALLRHRFEESDVEFEGYSENLESFLSLLQDPGPYLHEYLKSLQHLIVDEAQDVTGVRRRVILRLLKMIQEDAGVTVLGDPAQAIYGWTEPELDRESRSGGAAHTLIDQLLEVADLRDGFRIRHLQGEYRTGDSNLGSFFVSLRERLGEGQPEGTYRAVREHIADYAGRGAVRFEEISGLLSELPSDAMVLFRTTVSLAKASSYLSSSDVPHRLRFSGMPTGIVPWVGAMFGTYQEPYMTEAAFVDRWAELPQHMRDSHDLLDVWRICRNLAGNRSGRLDIQQFRFRLAGSRAPEDLVEMEIGAQGPVLSTIHAVKGREAPAVLILFPEAREDDDTDWQEEARVLYVGATRPRRNLDVYERPDPGYWGSLNTRTERIYQSLSPKKGAKRAQVMLGLNPDINPYFSVSNRLPSPSAAAGVQQWLAESNEWQSALSAKKENIGREDWRFLLKVGEDPTREDAITVGALSETLNSDLWRLAERFSDGGAQRKPPAQIRHIWLLGVRTFVAEKDSPYLTGADSPYDRTGFWLAPVIKGFPVAYFWRR